MYSHQDLLVGHHPKYYFEDGNLVLEVADSHRRVLFKLHRGILASRSTLFKTTLSLPRAQVETNVALEGSSDDYPLNLSTFTLGRITPRKFENLCMYLFSGPIELPRTVEFLTDVLDLSTFLEIEDGVTYAVNEFDTRDLLHPALRMELARLYRIDQWLSVAFRELVTTPLLELTVDHVNQMGLEAFYCLVETKAKLQVFQKQVAAISPSAVNDLGCRTYLLCREAWEQEWWNGLARNILHPDFTLTASDIKEQLSAVRVPGMCDGCQKATIDMVLEKDIFGREDEHIQVGITKLIAMLSGRPSLSPVA